MLSPLTRKSHLPMSGMFRLRFDVKLAGDLDVMASSGEEWSRLLVDYHSPSKDGCNLCVPAAQFCAAITNAQTEEASLSFQEHQVTIKSGGTTVIKTQNSEEFPKEPEDKFKEIGMETKDLAKVLRRVAFVPGRNIGESYPFKEVAQVTCNGAFECESTNGAMYAWAKWPTASGEAVLHVPKNALQRVCDALEQSGASLGLGERYLRVQHDSGASYYRLLEDVKWTSGSVGIKQIGEPLGGISTELFQREMNICSSIAQYAEGDRVLLRSEGKAMQILTKTVKGVATYESEFTGKFSKFDKGFHPQWISLIANQFKGESVKLFAHDNGLTVTDGELSVVIQRMA